VPRMGLVSNRMKHDITYGGLHLPTLARLCAMLGSPTTGRIAEMAWKLSNASSLPYEIAADFMYAAGYAPFRGFPLTRTGGTGGRQTEVEGWWNALTPEIRAEILPLVPVRQPEQIEVFSGRKWHELHQWMRCDLAKLYIVITSALDVSIAGE
jgi:hypothetical protein